ncbi:MAG: hypothetical protein Q6363_000390 [Candidatus Njordarchaeota archaeon]
MLFLSASGIRGELEKPKLLGVADKHTGNTIVIMNEKGEVIEEAKTYNAGKYTEHRQHSPKWLITHEEATLMHGHILINTKTLEMWEEITYPFHLFLQTPTATRPPLFRLECSNLRRFGGFYTYPKEKMKDMNAYLHETVGTPYVEKAKISTDEKTLCVNVKGETRIYSLEDLEMEEIITWDQITKALLRARAPRKMMRIVMRSNFAGLMDPKKTNIVWFIARWSLTYPVVPVAIFIYDREEREIIAGPKHPIEIILEGGVDEEYSPAKLVDIKKIYDPEYLKPTGIGKLDRLYGHIQGTYPDAAIFTLTVNVDGLAPNNDDERAKMGLPRWDLWTILLKIDENLHIKKYMTKFWYNNKQWIPSTTDIGGLERICCHDEDILLQCDFWPVDPYSEKDFYGFVRLNTNFELINIFDINPLHEWFIDEYELRDKRIMKLPSGEEYLIYGVGEYYEKASYDPDRKEIIVPIRVRSTRLAPKYRNDLYLFRTDWKAQKIREIKKWEGIRGKDIVVRWTTWI